MGGSKPKTRGETMDERNARLLSRTKSKQTGLELLKTADFLKASRSRGSMLGGAETGMVNPYSFGPGMATTMGSMR